MTSYDVLSRPEVAEDLKRLSRDQQNRILRAVSHRLSIAPENYGKPLGGTLRGLRRVRVGDYRVAYQVLGRQVILWAVMHRKDVYKVLTKRYPV